jgi:small subunit ribosomal protein S18
MPRNNNSEREKKAPRILKDNGRRAKKKTAPIAKAIDYVDYKDINFLRRYMSERGKIKARRATGLTSQQQRELSRAIKTARELALIPYATRVMSEKAKGPRNRDDDRGERGPRREHEDNTPVEGVDLEAINAQFETGDDVVAVGEEA